ncbi:Glyoxylase, beta-lactamase superfamily II [Aliiroseovarius halocynthiae]|uniref:MBL fold metallo-hydrolase n=1 Tax=Aliiroseovarius halocynthiae TaxID=985055 RepID=A0A545SZS6_9RHOB|nr:MBL fold metallo-hydrolase [Aliiroseovarius halocynthiae]TQV70476.1 MBL fold metallo-hydrolase [Aliiroseovarius halocynthiae]SMR81802.1 Glyoxylase, beta-lactamase superfamily II [Aliiroseovarius halocynthiae]
MPNLSSKLSRRAFGGIALATPALLTVGAASPVAAEPSQPAYLPAMFEAPMGSYRITALYDGAISLEKSLFFGPDQAEIDATLSGLGQTGASLATPVNAFLLQSDKHTILIDAGLGEIDFGPGVGRVSSALSQLGVTPEMIDTLILTHAHPDHLGGMLKQNAAAFPNAQLVTSADEHTFWNDDGIMAQAPEQMQGLFTGARSVFEAYKDRLVLVNDGAEVAPGVRLDLTPGHTMGHSVVHIDGGDQQILMVADSLLNADLQTAMPDVMAGFDTDPNLAVQSRRALLDRAATDQILISGSHLHFPGFGRFLEAGDGYRYVAASWL